MTVPAKPPPADSAPPVQPDLSPKHRAFLKRLRPGGTPALEALRIYFDLRGGTPEDRGRALDVLGRLTDPDNGYMNLAWHIALDWLGASHDRYGPKDLVQATAVEIQKALERPSGRDVLDRGWSWLIRTSARRARATADINGKRGRKSLGERGVKDALSQMDVPVLVDADEADAEAFRDDGSSRDERPSGDDLPASDGVSPGVDVPAADDSGEVHTAWNAPDYDGADALTKIGYDRPLYANDMAGALAEMHHHSEDLAWLVRFLSGYREDRQSETDDPQRLAVLDAILEDKKMSHQGMIVSELAALGLKLPRANDIKRQERSLLLGRLRAAAEMDGAVTDDFLYLIYQRLKRD